MTTAPQRRASFPSFPPDCRLPARCHDYLSSTSKTTADRPPPLTHLFAMKFDQLVSLLPCQSLEDFDLQRKEDDAEQLLSAWSTLWHPLLLASAQAIPRWLPATSPPPEPSNYLIILPDCCQPSLPEDWLPQAESAGACVLRNLPHRDDMLAAALERLGTDRPNVDADLAADFLALGFCHLQVELLTRKLRYMSNLDEAIAANRGAGGSRRSPPGQCRRPRAAISSRPSIGSTKPASISIPPKPGCST